MPTTYQERLLAEVTQPEEEPVSLAEAKLYLRVESPDDDALITQMIVAARQAAEQYLRRSLIVRQWKLAFDGGVAGEVALPMGPVQEIVSVSAIPEEDAPAIVNEAVYALNAARTRLRFLQPVTAYRVEVLYLAGYDAAASVPASVRQGMLAHVSELYDGRSAAAGLPDVAVALYLPHREVTL